MKASRVGLTFVVLFIGAVEDIEVVITNVIADKDIVDEFQDRGLSKTTLSNKGGVWPIRPIFLCFDDPRLERLHFTRNTVKTDTSEVSL